MSIPQNKQHLFWSKNVHELDRDHDRPYIIHQALAFGTLEEIQWLRTLYPVETIQRTFLLDPIKIYSPRAYHFAKRLLDIADRDAPPERYDQTLPRHIGS